LEPSATLSHLEKNINDEIIIAFYIKMCQLLITQEFIPSPPLTSSHQSLYNKFVVGKIIKEGGRDVEMKTMQFKWFINEARLIHFISSFARANAPYAYKDNDIPSLFYLETF
jgi:hypothetical protein